MYSLQNLPVLILDCQATGAHPGAGHLLEIGWAMVRASGMDAAAPEIETGLLPLPEGEVIPRRVCEITGITMDDLAAARSASEVWSRLSAIARTVAEAGGLERCPAVIHYARYEEPFLRHLHETHSPASLFPFHVLCTHEIAKRMLPDLPRRGIRAVAGYFGHSSAELRRSGHHVVATAHIWKMMTAALESEYGVRTLDDLLAWLAGTPGSVRTGRAYPMSRDIRLGVPDQPGVYRMLRSNGDVLYVGKADSLKRRVNSYFQNRSRHAEHILEMLSQARDLDVTVTGSALEAALLETDEIKRLSPPYNISLRTGTRALRFCSGDFRDFNGEADEEHPIGPLPSGELQAFPVIMDLLRDNAGEPADGIEPARALGIPEAYAPDRECFLAGFGLFSRNHGASLAGDSPAGILLRLGARLWKERLEERAEVEEDPAAAPDGEEEPEQPAGGEWTPEAVSRALEGVILRGAWMIRRARWLCLLSESAVVWRESRGKKERRRLLIVERGIITTREDLPDGREIPDPSGVRRPFRDRQRNLDLPAFDRMRVLTTEMRRILVHSGDLAVRLAPGAILTPEKLKRVLAWV